MSEIIFLTVGLIVGLLILFFKLDIFDSMLYIKLSDMHTLMVILKLFFEKFDFEKKKSAGDKKLAKLPSRQLVNDCFSQERTNILVS